MNIRKKTLLAKNLDWWLRSADSINHGYSVGCVDYGGDVCDYNYYDGSNGFVPICII